MRELRKCTIPAIISASLMASLLAGCDAPTVIENLVDNDNVTDERVLVIRKLPQSVEEGRFSIGDTQLAVGKSTFSEVDAAMGDAIWTRQDTSEEIPGTDAANLQVKPHSNFPLSYALIQEKTYANVTRDKDIFSGESVFANESDSSMPLADCQLQSISYAQINQTSKEDPESYGLPLMDAGGVEMGSSVSDVVRLLGEADKVSKTSSSGAVEGGDKLVEEMTYNFKDCKLVIDYWTGNANKITIAAK